MKVESISFPPLSSGKLFFPISECARAFFEGVMEFLDKHLYTSITKLNIVVIEKDKHKKFLDEWNKCYKARFGDDDEPGSDVESGDEVSNGSSDEEVKRPTHKKSVDKVRSILSISSDDDSTNKKSSAGMKKNTKMLFSSSDDDKPKKKASVKNNYSEDSDFDFTKNKVGTKTKLKTKILDSDSSDEVNQNQKAASKKKKDSSSDSDSDSDAKPKKKATPKKPLASDSDDS